MLVPHLMRETLTNLNVQNSWKIFDKQLRFNFIKFVVINQQKKYTQQLTAHPNWYKLST